MADTAVASETPAPATPAKKPKATSGGGVKKPKSKPTHPKTSEMVNNAIKELKERSGSSLQAIKKYIAAQYKVDAEKHAPFIRKYLKSAVESGALIQTKGKGASGSFKLESKSSASKKPAGGGGAKGAGGVKSSASSAVSKAKKASVAAGSAGKRKGTAVASASSGSPAKSKAITAKEKKAAAAAAKKKPTVAKRAAASTKARGGGVAPKAKKTAKPPTKKPKAPKPKKAATPKSKKATGAAKK